MASSNFPCDITQGFNFQKDMQPRVGHLTALKIGDTEYKKDLAVTDPTKVDGDKLKVVGVISNIYWEGGHASPVLVNCRLSTGNKEGSILLQHKSLSNTGVKFSFVIYDYDPTKEKYYPCFHTKSTALEGLVAKRGDDLDMDVDMDQAGDVVSPRNYNFFVGVMPSEKEQEIHFAVNVEAQFAKKWGVTVAE